jgi:hypothetical protein
MNPQSPQEDEGSTEQAPAAAAREDIGTALNEAIEEAIHEERQARLDAVDGSARLYPRPLRAGAQAYVDPKVWKGGMQSEYRSVVELMTKLDDQRGDEPD